MFKEQKGITLIALVITIIVLLILAGVSIAMISGQDGIATKAQNAKEESAWTDTKNNIGTIASDAMATYYDVRYAESKGGSSEADKTAVNKATDAGAYVRTKLDAVKGEVVTGGVTLAIAESADTDGNYTLTLTGFGKEKTGKITNSGSVTWDNN